MEEWEQQVALIGRYLTPDVVTDLAIRSVVIGSVLVAIHVLWQFIRQPPGSLFWYERQTQRLLTGVAKLERETAELDGHIAAIKSAFGIATKPAAPAAPGVAAKPAAAPAAPLMPPPGLPKL